VDLEGGTFLLKIELGLRVLRVDDGRLLDPLSPMADLGTYLLDPPELAEGRGARLSR
jgi:hypothetical protein